jgi:hypothetical protein
MMNNVRKKFGVALMIAWAVGLAGVLIDQQPGSGQQQVPTARHADVKGRDPSLNTPCARTPADDDPDVAKRPCFRDALAELRTIYHFDFASNDPSWILVPGDEVPATEKELMIARWEKVVAGVYLPLRVEPLQWGGYRYAGDPELVRFVAKWATRGQTIVGVGFPRSDVFLLWLHLRGDDRISFRIRPGGERLNTYGQKPGKIPQDFIDKERLLEILTTQFQFPYKTLDDFFVIDTTSDEIDGVRVFKGEVESRYMQVDFGRYNNPGDKSTLHWYDRVSLFITDSEPQYFYLGIKFQKGDVGVSTKDD